MPIQLPDDVISKGYVKSKTNAFEWEQVFYSKQYNFTGTELDFVKAEYGYHYTSIDAFRRIVLTDNKERR